MILFFGTRPGKSSSQLLQGVSCPFCGQRNTLTVISRPNYAHLFWIPIFTINSSTHAECSHCKKYFYKEEFSTEMKQASQKVSITSSKP
ncbi:MAG: zinc-ribbon domain-containing protein [Bacteroidota bacterium]